MANQWFRLYAEFVTDPKVQMMSEAMQRRLVMLMGMRCCNDLETFHETEVAFQLRISERELEETKALFIEKGFIDEKWKLRNWEKRQFASDSSTERVRAHRQKAHQSNGTGETSMERFSNAPEQNRTEQNRTENTLTPAAGENSLLDDLPPTDEGVFEIKDKNLPPAKRAAKKAGREAVRRLFAYYLERTERNPKLYTLTPTRMQKALACLKECERKCDGDLVTAEAMMSIAIDALVASDYHAGKNEQHKEYTDWTENLFKSTDKLEWWLNK
jgi:hypothetical protein